jgi:ribosomal protein L7/L12
MWPQDFQEFHCPDNIPEEAFRYDAEKIILDRYKEEVEAEMVKLRKTKMMRKVAAQLHTLAPRQTINIIKTMRLIYGLGLKEAKELVEQTAPLPF